MPAPAASPLDLRNPSVMPDLLHHVPMARTDLVLLREALRFAFASGGSDVPLYECFDETQLAFSTWTPEFYSSDLYLEAFLNAHASLEINGGRFQARVAPLLRILNHPPQDLKNTHFRQGVLRELAENTAFRASAEQAYVSLSRFRDLLGDSGLGERLDVNRRRIDVLEAGRAAIEILARGFEGATSGLVRLRDFARRVQATEEFDRLSKLLAFEDGMASIEARLQIGYDGQLRHFEIVRSAEAKLNPFYASRLGRLWRRFSLLIRGYFFSDAEVLSRFVDQVFLGVEAEFAKFFQILSDLEFYLVALRFRDHAQQQNLEVCLPEVSSQRQLQDGSLTAEPRLWIDLFNPLLVRYGEPAVPCTLSQERSDDIVLLTGPNSGGKTRLLQALSLGQILGQGGYFVPASKAQLVTASAMFLSIGEHADENQREGRLGSELLRIRKVFESVRPGAFVVVDELCSGTNPSEGEEIFRMVLTLLRELGPQVFISTHFLEFAASLARDPSVSGLDFLRVELDVHDRPTYRFVPGVATTSLAQQTAARLGVTSKELRALIEQHRRMNAPPRKLSRNG